MSKKLAFRHSVRPAREGGVRDRMTERRRSVEDTELASEVEKSRPVDDSPFMQKENENQVASILSCSVSGESALPPLDGDVPNHEEQDEPAPNVPMGEAPEFGDEENESNMRQQLQRTVDSSDSDDSCMGRVFLGWVCDNCTTPNMRSHESCEVRGRETLSSKPPGDYDLRQMKIFESFR